VPGSSAALPLLTGRGGEGEGVVWRRCGLLLLPGQPWRRGEARAWQRRFWLLQAGAAPLTAGSLLFSFLWLNGRVRIWGCRGGRGGLVCLPELLFDGLRWLVSVSPSGPYGCRAPAPMLRCYAGFYSPRRPKWPSSPVVVWWPVRSDSVGGLVEARRT
jgi:hypothetical protein